MLAYHTQQELKVLDRRLGYFFYVAFLIIFIYIVVWVRYLFCWPLQNFGIKKMYLNKSPKEGFVYIKGFGEAYSAVGNWTHVWDTSNLLFLPIEDQSVSPPSELHAQYSCLFLLEWLSKGSNRLAFALIKICYVTGTRTALKRITLASTSKIQPANTLASRQTKRHALRSSGAAPRTINKKSTFSVIFLNLE